MKWKVGFLLSVALCCFFMGCGPGLSFLILSGSEVSSFTLVDGGGANGINKVTSSSTDHVRFTVFNSKLYAIWQEFDASPGQMRVGVYNGNDSAPSWALVDGGGGNGINHNGVQQGDNPVLTDFNSKLYASWEEQNGGVFQIRVAVYNGNDSAPTWTFVDGNLANGINHNTAQNAHSPILTVFNSKLYAHWFETNGGFSQIRVAVYNGNDGAPSWTFVDGNGANGINKNTAKNAASPISIVLNSKFYATWYEDNGIQNQIRAAVYNGNDGAPSWTFVDGNGVNGINHDSTHNADTPTVSVLNSKLYATWNETNGVASQIRVAVYNGNDGAPAWTFVDGNGLNGINHDATQSASFPASTIFNSKMYVTWEESTATLQIRVAVYNGSDSVPSWTFVDGNGANGINRDTAKTAIKSKIAALNSKLYAIWIEHNGVSFQVRTALGLCSGSTVGCNFSTSRNW